MASYPTKFPQVSLRDRRDQLTVLGGERHQPTGYRVTDKEIQISSLVPLGFQGNILKLLFGELLNTYISFVFFPIKRTFKKFDRRCHF